MTGFTPETEACLACHPSQKDVEPMTDKAVGEAVERVKAYAAALGPDASWIIDRYNGAELTCTDLRALLSALELGRHLAKDALPGGETHPSALQEPSADGWRPIEAAAYETLALGDRWLDPVLLRLADGTVTVARMSADEWLIPQGVGTFADLCAEPVAWKPLSASTTDSGKGRLDAEAGGWRRIESAPKDGTRVLVSWRNREFVEIMRAEAHGFPEYVTHWRHLPAPPTGEGGGL